jgi:hypothetical protein
MWLGLIHIKVFRHEIEHILLYSNKNSIIQFAGINLSLIVVTKFLYSIVRVSCLTYLYSSTVVVTCIVPAVIAEYRVRIGTPITRIAVYSSASAVLLYSMCSNAQASIGLMMHS